MKMASFWARAELFGKILALVSLIGFTLLSESPFGWPHQMPEYNIAPQDC